MWASTPTYLGVTERSVTFLRMHSIPSFLVVGSKKNNPTHAFAQQQKQCETALQILVRIADGLSCLTKAFITADIFSYFKGNLNIKMTGSLCTLLPAARFANHFFLKHIANAVLTIGVKGNCGRIKWSDGFWGTRFLTQNPALRDPFHSWLSSRPPSSIGHVPIAYLNNSNSSSLSVQTAWYLF